MIFFLSLFSFWRGWLENAKFNFNYKRIRHTHRHKHTVQKPQCVMHTTRFKSHWLWIMIALFKGVDSYLQMANKSMLCFDFGLGLEGGMNANVVKKKKNRFYCLIKYSGLHPHLWSASISLLQAASIQRGTEAKPKRAECTGAPELPASIPWLLMISSSS